MQLLLGKFYLKGKVSFLCANTTVGKFGDVRNDFKTASLTFVVTYSLEIAMLVFVGCLDSDMRAINASDNTAKCSSLVKGRLCVSRQMQETYS